MKFFFQKDMDKVHWLLPNIFEKFGSFGGFPSASLVYMRGLIFQYFRKFCKIFNKNGQIKQNMKI